VVFTGRGVERPPELDGGAEVRRDLRLERGPEI
jgi:hypothetical protein